MATYIILGVCMCFILALSARDIFHSRKLHGTTSEERLGHQWDYELGFPLLFKRLPGIHLFGKPRFGSSGSRLVLAVLILFVLGLLASVADGTLFIPGDDIGFFEDSASLSVIVAIAATFYLFRRVMDMVPEALRSILRDTSDDLSQVQVDSDIEGCLQEVASVLFQTEEGRGRWGRALDVGLTIGFASFAVLIYASGVFNPAEIVNWKGSDHFWGNMFGIIQLGLVFVYVVPRGLGYLVRLIWSLWYLGKKLGGANLLRIQPLNPDGAGGLGKFGNLAWRIDLVLLPILVVAVAWYMVWDITPTYVTSLIMAILLIPFFFFGPLWSLHEAMKKAKNKELRLLSQKFDPNASIVKRWLNNEEGVKREDGLEATEVLERIILLHERTSRMPVWPFDHTTLTKVSVYILIPIIAMVLQNALW